MILRACIDCGALSDQAHCPDHRGRERNGSTWQWRKVRAAVLKRDRYTCHYCGASPVNVVDHLRPISRGGTDDEANLTAACAGCNAAKGDMTSAEFGLANDKTADNLALGLGLLRRVGVHPKETRSTDAAPLPGRNSSEIGGAIRGR